MTFLRRPKDVLKTSFSAGDFMRGVFNLGGMLCVAFSIWEGCYVWRFQFGRDVIKCERNE